MLRSVVKHYFRSMSFTFDGVALGATSGSPRPPAAPPSAATSSPPPRSALALQARGAAAWPCPGCCCGHPAARAVRAARRPARRPGRQPYPAGHRRVDQAAVCAVLAFADATGLVIGLVALLACGLALTQPCLAALLPGHGRPGRPAPGQRDQPDRRLARCARRAGARPGCWSGSSAPAYRCCWTPSLPGAGRRGPAAADPAGRPTDGDRDRRHRSRPGLAAAARTR